MKNRLSKKYNFFILSIISIIVILLISCILIFETLVPKIKTKIFSSESLSNEDININEVPYISTYYIKPKVSPNEDVIIDYYVTDYYHKEYTEESTSEKFTITVKIDGQKDIVKKNVKAGDNSINIGKFKNTGEQKFSIIATDQYGRNSHELFNFILVEDSKEKEKSSKEYIMTKDDLIKYNIKNTDTYENKHIATLNIENPTPETVKAELEKIAETIIPSPNTYTCIIADTIGNGEPGNWWGENIVKYADDYNKETVMQEAANTRAGLQQLLDDVSFQGYTYIKLLPGTYRIDHKESIFIPSNLTLDMNGATIKLNQFTGDSALMITLNNTYDSHVTNGIIEGNYYGHDYANSPNNSEWVMGISIGGESKYSSFENLILKDITGYGEAKIIPKIIF